MYVVLNNINGNWHIHWTHNFMIAMDLASSYSQNAPEWVNASEESCPARGTHLSRNGVKKNKLGKLCRNGVKKKTSWESSVEMV